MRFNESNDVAILLASRNDYLIARISHRADLAHSGSRSSRTAVPPAFKTTTEASSESIASSKRAARLLQLDGGPQQAAGASLNYTFIEQARSS
jgi:hypothetical protein